jgi:hypothetical protein
MYSTILAPVALDPDWFKRIGTGFECHIELALPGRRVDGWLRWREPVRTGAQ